MKSRQNKEAADLARSQARERLKAAKRQYMRARQDECNASLNNSSSSNVFDGENSAFLVLWIGKPNPRRQMSRYEDFDGGRKYDICWPPSPVEYL